LLDEDPLRQEIWTHAGAYSASDNFDLVAAADPLPEKSKQLTERYGGKAYTSSKEMLADISPEVVSICTPASDHYQDIMMSAAIAGVKAIFCEKPLAATAAEAEEIIEVCSRQKILLLLNHPRRWDDNYLVPARMIRDGRIGDVKVVNVLYSNKLLDTGTHLFDTLRLLIGEIDWVAGELHDDSPEPFASGYLHFACGATGSIGAVGCREDLIFEFDIVGSEGRIRLLDNGTRMELYQWQESKNYTGYRELAPETVPVCYPQQRMLDAVANLASALDENAKLACRGEDGLAALKLIEAFKDSSADDSKSVCIKI